MREEKVAQRRGGVTLLDMDGADMLKESLKISA